jgi:hypothetical protein
MTNQVTFRPRLHVRVRVLLLRRSGADIHARLGADIPSSQPAHPCAPRSVRRRSDGMLPIGEAGQAAENTPPNSPRSTGNEVVPQVTKP